MQKIKLFSQYDLDAIFLKTRREIFDQLRQWPERYFDSEQIQSHIEALKKPLQLNLPDIDFKKGNQVLAERIYPASVFQPGNKSNSKFRVTVLIFQYPAEGQLYLLGCCPPLDVPDPIGEWYVDPVHQHITIEYLEYEKHPKKAMAAHQNYTTSLQLCYESLKNELASFNDDLDNMIEAAITERKRENDGMKGMLV